MTTKDLLSDFFNDVEPIYDNWRTNAALLYHDFEQNPAPQQQISCHKGCGACCHFALITATAGEAFVLYHLLVRAMRDPEVLNAHLQGYATRYFQHVRDKGSLPFTDAQQREFSGLKLPCPLLKKADDEDLGGFCGVYPVRPIICESFHSLDNPELCKTKQPHRTLQTIVSKGEAALDEIRTVERRMFGRSTLGHLPLLLAAFSTKDGAKIFLNRDFRNGNVDSLDTAEAQAVYDFWLYRDLLACLDYDITETDLHSLEEAQNAMLNAYSSNETTD